MYLKAIRWLLSIFVVLAVTNLLILPASAAVPVVKTVPWVASNPLIPHDTYAGKSIRLKGTADVQGATILYTWDFGDGSPVVTGTVTNKYVIEAAHTYVGAVGAIWTARLTVQNTSTGDTGSKAYYVAMRAKTLPVEVNVAIDEGLWYLHKQLNRDYPAAGQGLWYGGPGGYASQGYPANTAINLNAFEVNGHLESGSADNPYTETVSRGMKGLFSWLTVTNIPATQTNPLGTFPVDTNGNGKGVIPSVGGNYFYQSGMIMDAIMASGTPNAVTTTGPVGIIGRTYRDIVQDYADLLYYAQYDSNPRGGGWRYNINDAPDNSPCQWAAIGLIPWDRLEGWGKPANPVPSIVKNWNKVWLRYSQQFTAGATFGAFGYTDPGYYPWGPYAVTPSGMVQMVMDGIGRGNVPGATDPSWDNAETFMCNNFCNGGGVTNAVKDYYYGLFSFVKALLLHDSNGDGVAEPITILQSSTNSANNIDWYGAEAINGDRCDGVARTLVNDQNAAGYWFGHYADGSQGYFETGEAIIMLNGTIFEAGAPVAVAKAIPNPAVAGQIITLDGSDSFHQDASKSIDSWEWDLDNDGAYDDATGPIATISFPAVGNYPVGLRVTDNANPEKSATTSLTILVSTPPIAPTANAGGPYNFCLGSANFFLNGSASINPDDGQHQPGAFPGDFIQSYLWDLPGDDGAFDDANGATPNVTAFFTGLGVGSYLVQLKVTDNTAASYPASGMGDLSATDSAQVQVKAATDPTCSSCVRNLAARAKPGEIQLTWTHVPVAGWDHYNIYRSTVNGGPYLKIAETKSTYSTYLNTGLTNGTTYYYVVRGALLNGNEICQSNQAAARPVTR